MLACCMHLFPRLCSTGPTTYAVDVHSAGRPRRRPERGQARVDDVRLGQAADAHVERGALRCDHAGQAGVGQRFVHAALHERAAVVVLDVPKPLRQHSNV